MTFRHLKELLKSVRLPLRGRSRLGNADYSVPWSELSQMLHWLRFLASHGPPDGLGAYFHPVILASKR